MPLLTRALAFLRRFAPFWAIWLLVLAIPATREMWRLHFVGSPLVRLYDQPWRQSFGRGKEFNGFRIARQKPRDLGAQLWSFSLLLRGASEVEEEFDSTIQNRNLYNYYSGDPNGSNAQGAKRLLREAKSLQNAFPEQGWLRALPVRVLASEIDGLCDVKPKIAARFAAPSQSALSPKRALELAQITRNAARFEPRNAYYALVEAEIWRRGHNPKAMWNALGRAAKGQVFDTHELEFARAVVGAYETVRPLLLEERDELWRACIDSEARGYASWPSFFRRESRIARKVGDHARNLQIAAIVGGVGDLMQRGNNTRTTAVIGAWWKSSVWAVTPRPNLRRAARRAWWKRRTEHFASYASAHGRRDLALLAPKWAARQRKLIHLERETYYYGGSGSVFSPAYSGYGPVMRPSPRDALARAGKWRNAGVFLALHGGFLALFWLASNLFLWRGAGAASATKTRFWPAFWVAAGTLALALWVWRQAEIFDAAAWNTISSTQRGRLEGSVASVGVLAFFGAPFLLALVCAVLTMRTHRAQFFKSARIETELRLIPRDAALLKSGVATLALLAVASTFTVWLLWLVFAAFDVKTIDPFARWPRSWPSAARSDAWDLSFSSEMVFAPLFYCLFLDFLCWLGWFFKWRYYSGPDSRVLTHGGLRRWKESLGVYLVIVSALYLGVALGSWPDRAAAARELEVKMARGELPP